LDEGAGLDVRTVGGPTRQGWRLSVHDGRDLVAEVAVGRSRTLLTATGVASRPDRPQGISAAAWPAESARRAAADRIGDRHPGILTVARLDLGEGAGARARAVLDAVGAHLTEAGARRLDVRTDPAEPIQDWLVGGGWMRGDAGGTAIATRSLQYPWSLPRGAGARWSRSLPRSLRRVQRRVSTMQPSQVPELTRIATGELAAAVRLRYTPGPARVQPVEGAPPGSSPFQVTRYRTIQQALALVPPELQATRLVDIGCGDGRVLREAIDRGWTQVHGREIDPELGQRAAAAIVGHGTVDVGDGLVAPLPDDTGVVYLNNPFQADGVARLAHLLGESLVRRRRPLVIVYINPQTIGPLVSEGFALVQCAPAYSMLTFAAP
jgi:SAM-dependent methyltransferase